MIVGLLIMVATTLLPSVPGAPLVEAAFEPVQCFHGGQALPDAGVGLAALADRGKELAVLQFDAVHGYIDIGNINGVLVSVEQVVIPGDECTVVADVTEEGPEGAFVVERERQRADGPGRDAHADRHIHRDPEDRMQRALQGEGVGGWLPGLVLEEIHGVAGVVPEEMIRPTPGLARGVGVGPAEEVRLDIHLLDLEFTGEDLPVDPLVARVEPPGMPAHGDQTGFALDKVHPLRVGERISDGDFDHDVLACAHALLGLSGVHLGGSGKDYGLDAGLFETFGEIAGPVGNAELAGNFLGSGRIAPCQGNDFDTLDLGDCLQVLDSERPLTGQPNFHAVFVPGRTSISVVDWDSDRIQDMPRTAVIAALMVAWLEFQAAANAQIADYPADKVADIPVNYTEALAGKYTLPDPLTLLNGQKVKDAKTWNEKRRPEIVRLFEENQYGRAPGRPADLSFEVFDNGTPAYDGLAIRRQVTIHFNAGFSSNSSAVDDPGVKQGEIWGRDKKRVPAAQGRGFGKLNVPAFVKEGFGIATIYYGDIDPDFEGGVPFGVRAMYLKPGQSAPAPEEWGAVSAWAWGLSRALDYLETDKGVDSKRVAVTGVSRLGKTVMWAGARDTRFAMVIASCSGEGGAALSRRNYGRPLPTSSRRAGTLTNSRKTTPCTRSTRINRPWTPTFSWPSSHRVPCCCKRSTQTSGPTRRASS